MWPAVRPGWTFVIVFAMFAGLLFILQLGARGPLIGMAMAGLLLVTNRQALPGLFGPRGYIFLFPGLCLLSAAWSEDPFGSFRSGLEMVATIGAGLILSLVDRRKEMLERSGGRATYPQIFIGDRHVGGCDDLHELDARGELDGLLR